MAVVRFPTAFPGAGEGLAGAGAGPHPTISGSSSKGEGVGPPSDPGKEVALGIPFDVIGGHLPDVTLIYLAEWQLLVHDQIPQPLAAVGVDLVIVDH